MRTRSEVIAARKAEKKVPVWERGANEEQLQVIRHETGPCRVLAAAGCHRRGQGVLMADGSIQVVELVRVGEQLMGPDGLPRIVQELCRGRGRMFAIEPIKGRSWVVNEDHILTTIDSNTEIVSDISVREFLNTSPHFRAYNKLFRVGVDKFWRMDDWPTWIAPYFLGVVLGDGGISANSVEVCTADPEIVEVVYETAEVNRLFVRVMQAGGKSKSYVLSAGNCAGLGRNKNPVVTAMRDLGLMGTNSGTKFIPKKCLLTSREDRLELLAGLVDTDGYVYAGCVDYVTKSTQLAEDILFLARSLGFAAYCVEKKSKDQYGTEGIYRRISISGDVDQIPCRIQRKIAPKRRQVKSVLRTGFKVEPLAEDEEFFGFRLDGDQRYLLDDFTATHNSGKTHCVTRRIVRLVELDIVPAERILATTFSKKAADEMNKRLKELGVSDARVGTWHSLCLQILREDHTKWADWEIDGSNDKPQRAKYLLKEVLGYKHMDWKSADLSKVNSFIGRCKANLFAPDSEEAAKFAEKEFSWDGKKVLEAFHRYNQLLEEKEIITYDDFMVFVVEYLSSDEDARQTWASKWDQVLCDEVQDNNAAQQRITHLLAGDHRNYMAVGDAGQAIYGFRGSSPEFIAKFEEEWTPDAKTIWLPRNYRSGKEIVAAANQIIRPMKLVGFEPKDMIGERQLDGEVKIVCAEALDDEANIVVDRIAKSVNAGDAEYSSHTVLYRLNAQSRAVEEALLKQRIPYVVVGGVSFYERREVRDLLAYLRLAAGRAKVEDIKRSINTPFRFLGAKFVERVMAEVDEDVIEDANWPAIVDLVSNQDRIQSRQRASARDWSLMIRAMQDKIKQAAAIEDAPTSPDSPEAKVKELARPAVLLEDVVRQTRYIEWLQKEEGGETTENSGPANVREMVRVAERFPSTEELLDYVDHTIRASKKQREAKQAGGNRVILMSIHRCVSPDTLVETARGLVPIAEIPEDGTIGTTEGPRPYVGKVSYTDREMLRVTTTSGYVVEVTTDHRMMAWKGGAYEEIEAQNLERGQFLRLALGESVEVVDEVRLPKAPAGDVRANVYSVPEILDESVAELFGLLVADGTVFDRGFRLSKRYADVVDRFVELTKANFGASPSWEEIPLKNKLGVYYGATVSSTILAAWLLSMRGFGPHAKAVPAEILRSPLRVQAKFLRGLFEDGTVNVKGSRLDHVAFTTCYAEMAKVVQTMLLRFGIICSRRSYGGLWRLSIYGANAERFAAHIGFVSARKNAQLASAQAGPETRYLVPVDRARFRGGWDAWGDLVFFAQNAVARGYITRDAAAKYGYEEGLRYHHERIVSIEAFRGSAMCVTVPSHGRFLQNGFDGCNSKGLEWPHVYVIGMNESILPHIKGDVEEERRVAYVAATRARDFLMLSYVRRIATRAGVKDAAPSRFLLDTGLPLDVPRDVPEETAAFPETPSVTPG